ncbi:RadC family protein [Pleurocapsa sp. FMAR1]|uniref:RadC family protein n=1 Tax=Pleurocapsa sp. FMAR1 TaxID=3040204 RepID=UPI0029C74697|nr:DNA repair protein RadC [Pleurocapsa sp. FMAR1]
MTYSLRIADLPISERPRERLMAVGAKNLTEAELLAILISTGQTKGNLSAIGLGQHILQELGKYQRSPLDMLRDVNPRELMSIPGIGPAKAATIVAAVELGKRTFKFRPNERVAVDSPASAAAVLSHDLMWQDQERFAIVMLDVKNRLLATKILTIGTATETLIHPREVFRETIRQGATKLIIAHNHPSGNLEPSSEDIYLTEQLLQGSQCLDIPLLDHLILGNGDHQSLRQKTDLWQRYPQSE